MESCPHPPVVSWRPRVRRSTMDSSERTPQCPARGACPVFLAMSAGTVRYTPSCLGPGLQRLVGEKDWDTGR